MRNYGTRVDALIFYAFLCGLGAILLAVVITRQADSASDQMDKQIFTDTKVDPEAYKGWRGEVVKCEEMTEGLYKILVVRIPSSGRMDTLLSTSKLIAGDKVDYQKVVAYNNDMPVNIKIAVPVTK